MAIIKKIRDTKYWEGCEKETLVNCWWNLCHYGKKYAAIPLLGI